MPFRFPRTRRRPTQLARKRARVCGPCQLRRCPVISLRWCPRSSRTVMQHAYSPRVAPTTRDIRLAVNHSHCTALHTCTTHTHNTRTRAAKASRRQQSSATLPGSRPFSVTHLRRISCGHGQHSTHFRPSGNRGNAGTNKNRSRTTFKTR